MFAEAPAVYPTCSEISSRSELRGKRNSQFCFWRHSHNRHERQRKSDSRLL